MFPLSYFQHMSVPRKMEWDISRYVPEITLGDLGLQRVHRYDSHDRSVLGLFPGSRKSDVPAGEIPQLGTTFLNAFMEAEGDYPVEFRMLDGALRPCRAWRYAKACGAVFGSQGRAVWHPTKLS